MPEQPLKPRREASHFQNCQIQTASLSQKNQSLIKPLLKNSFPTIFQGPGPVEAPFHFSRFVCWVHYCSKLCQSSPWRREASHFQNCQIQTASLSQKNQSLIKPLLKNSFPTIFQGPGPVEAPFHFSRFVCWVHYCSKLCQSSPWRREASHFQNCQIQTASLSQKNQSLIKPLSKNSFPTIFQGPGPVEAPFHFSRFVCWVHYCSKLCQSSPWKPRREASHFQNCQIQTASLSQKNQSLIKPLLKNSFPTIFQGPGPVEAPFHFSRFVCWVHYCSKLCQSSPWRREASNFQNCQIQTASLSQKNQSLIKPLLKNSFPTIFQGPGPVEAPFHFSRFVCWAHYCSKLCQSSPWRREASNFQNCQIQTASLSQKNQSLIKPLLKNSFPTIFQGPGPVEAPFHFSRFVCWVHYCSKLCQSSPGRREASHFQNCQIQTASLSQKNQSLIKPLLKNSFSTIFQGPGPVEAPFHFSRFVCWVHYCSKLCQSSPCRREASHFQNCQIQTASLSQKNQSLIKPLLKNSFSTIFQGSGPVEAPFHFSRFVCWVHYCSKLCQSSPWKPRREASHFQNCQIQTPSLSQKNQSLIKPLLKNV